MCLTPRRTVIVVRLLFGSVPDAVVAQIAASALDPSSSRDRVRAGSLLLSLLDKSKLLYLGMGVTDEPPELTRELQREAL